MPNAAIERFLVSLDGATLPAGLKPSIRVV